MRTAATVAVVAIAMMAPMPGWMHGAAAGARSTFEDALNRSTLCPSLPPLNVCRLSEAVRARTCRGLTGGVTARFDRNAHEVRPEDRFAFAVNGRLFVTFELACLARSDGAVPNLRYAEDITCEARISGDCTASGIACSPTNEEGPMFEAFDDLAAEMKAPLEAAAAETALCQ